jgi:ferric-dicitrate binding protein FerR (iron transport regulator)
MKNKDIEELLPSYFENRLTAEEREKVEQWKETSDGNRQLFDDSQKAWEGIEHLRNMKKYRVGEALQKVHSKIAFQQNRGFLEIFRRVAAILVLPLLAATIWFFLNTQTSPTAEIAWNTLETPAGMRSEFVLPDGTKVWLNSKTSLRYPMSFQKNFREVELDGEAYFKVAEDKKHPFVVTTGKVNIEVTGTEFKASNYRQENLTEIVLVSGSIQLFKGDYSNQKSDITPLRPGERFSYDQKNRGIHIDKVDVEKYIAWKDGVLVFRDDTMPEVVRRLNRWFNVDIQLTGPELKDYVYTATFEDESLLQILELLKISAPIDYTIKKRERKTNETFSKMEIIIKQK